MTNMTTILTMMTGQECRKCGWETAEEELDGKGRGLGLLQAAKECTVHCKL